MRNQPEPSNFAAIKAPISQEALDQLFSQARTHSVWLPEPVPVELLRKAYELARLGPTSANGSPVRFVFLTTPGAKALLKPVLAPGNVDKTMRGAAGPDAVDKVTVEITRAGEEPEIRVPMDLRKALAAAPLAQAGWEDITPMARRDWIFSISSAKQPETRKRRIEKACDMLGSGKRRLCCFPGIKWLMKKNAKSCGMWLPLPNSQNRFLQIGRASCRERV